MKPKPAGSKRNRIILIYILGVALPGLVLGYMAFRGIQSDEALREKQTRQELNLVAQDFFQLLDAQWDDAQAMATFTTLSLLKQEHLEIINHKLLFLPDKYLDESQLNDLSFLPDAGWELEFINQDYPGAIRFHEKIISGSNDPQKICSSLLAQARIYKKQNKSNKALEIYQILVKEYPKEKIGQLPIILVANQEIAEIHLALGNVENSQDDYSQLASNLLHPGISYSEQSFDVFYANLKVLENQNQKTDSLLHEIEVSLNRTRYLNKFLSNADDYLRSPNNQKTLLTQNGYRDLLITQVSDSSNTKARLVDLEAYFTNTTEELIKQIDPNQDYIWNLTDQLGNLLFQQTKIDEILAFSFPFPAPLSGWKLELQKNPATLVSSLFSSGRGFYIVMFILLSLWLILGLFFTIYMLNQEIKLNRMKSRFISNVSHEFKSPVTSIRHMSELMKLKRVRTEEKKEEFYESMVDQCDHLSHLIENIMDFSKIEDEIKKYEFDLINIRQIIEDLTEIHRNRLSESGIQVIFSAKKGIPDILADKDAIQQVVYNLLDNAAKYASRGLRIDVNLSVFNNTIKIEVKDYGKGIPTAEQTKIFDRFYRVSDKSFEGIKGSGIGLTLVKKIVESHGGKIELSSKLDKGSSFFVFLPIKKDHES